jgi:hypothetical protein
MSDPLTLLLTAIGAMSPIIALLFKMLIAEKDARIKYLEDENTDLRDIARVSSHQTGEALTVAKQRGS